MITSSQLKILIEAQEKAKNQFASDAQADLNKRLSIVQQAEAERVQKVHEYQAEINHREGAIEALKKLVEPEKTPEPLKALELPGTPHSRSV